ncbi:MAG: ATP-binding cassette domain-containing protein, partial [bacterium]|nr:ATP-binding cassette domain-containing protein [bacterium]
MSLSVLASLVLALSMQLVSLKFVAPLLDNVPEAKTGKAQPAQVEGRLELDGVTFSYPGQPNPALSNVSLAIKAGEFVAVVGMSGSGKSSLAKMIAGLDKPTRGRVFLGDFDLQSLDRHVMRENIGVVQQDFRLLPGTLFENIQGATQCSIEDAWEAARIACINADIREFPMGMHTMVSGDSQVFSGGQIQRIAIARALVRKPKVMVFDEATSALDNRVQGRIMKNLS